MPSALPTVLTQLVTIFTANSTAAVSLGMPMTGIEAETALFVGVDDVDDTGSGSAATAHQEWATVGHTTREETGEVTCVAVARNADTDAVAAMNAVFGVFSSIEAALKTAPDLGMSASTRSGFGEEIDFSQQQDDQGALAVVVFTVKYATRI